MKVLLSLLAVATGVSAASTELIFNPASPESGPFPSDTLTVSDNTQRTGKRIKLPTPAVCSAGGQLPSDCTDRALLNELDGFSLTPRLRLCFTGPIDANSIDNGVLLIPLHRPFDTIKVGQVFYEPASYCASAKPEEVLESGRIYVMVVTPAVRDAAGKAIKPSKEYKDWLKGRLSSANDLSQFVALLVAKFGAIDTNLAGVSVFTTVSATNWMEKARAYVNSSQAPSVVQPVGPQNGFDFSTLTGFKWIAQTNVNGSTVPFDLPVSLPGVGRIAFGAYFSPNFLAVSGPDAGTIPQTGTAKPIVQQAQPVIDPSLPGFVPVGFHVFLPSSPKPAGGYPVAIYGHGLGDSRFGATTAIASTLALNGIATVGVEIVGHGFGPGSSVELSVGGVPVSFPAPGRGIPVSASGEIGPTDGCVVPGPVAVRDCLRQTAVDLIALVKAIRSTGGYYGQLDPSRIYYVGQSFGAIIGTFVNAVEPNLKAAALNVGGGSTVSVARLAGERPLAIAYLGMRTPSLLNKPFGFPHPLNYDFEDNYVLRGQAPVTNPVPGAAEEQAAFEVAEWLNSSGDALSYAADLKRPVLFQFAKGDEEVPNPTNSALIRTANARTSSRYFRFDLAKQVPGAQLPLQPHRFLSNPDIFKYPAQLSIALAAQQQVAGFLASGGATIPDANQYLQPPFTGMKLFEIPSTLPETLNFVRKPASPPVP